MIRPRSVFALLVGTMLMGVAPARAAVTVFTDEATFNAAISGETTYTPTKDASFASTYDFGPVTAQTDGFFVTYTGDYGPGVRSLGAFLSPVTYTSSQNVLGLNLGYYIGPQTATYTIDGVTGTILVPDNGSNPNNTFIGFTDTSPINVSFDTDSAEFDTLKVTSGSVATVSAAPEPSTWALLLAGVGWLGLMMRRAKMGRWRCAGDAAAA